MQQRYDLEATWDTIKSVTRSSSFLFFHLYNGSIVGCGLRNTFGRFYYRLLVCIPALVSSYSSLLIEKPARRQALAFYVLNLASETIYRMAVTKGYFKPMKHGETLLFALSLAAWYHLIKLHGFGRDPVSAVFKVLIGRQEAARWGNIEKGNKISEKIDVYTKAKQSDLMVQVKRAIDGVGQKLDPFCNGIHPSCPHFSTNHTCLGYILEPIPSRFLSGYLIQVVLRLASKPQKLLQTPLGTIGETLTASSSMKFGLFLATLVSAGRLTSCTLRRISGIEDPLKQPQWHAACSGFVAGLSMLWAPRSSISLYVMWKAVEQYYLLMARQNKIKYFNFTILTIYSFSAATLLYVFALEPSLMRPSYMKFLDNISDHRLHQLNRMVLDVFGTGSSVGYEDYFPDLDPKYMSNQFKELVFNWMIQPYE